MSSNKPSVKAALAACTTALAVVLGTVGLLSGSSANADTSLGTLSFDPVTGTDISQVTMNTHSSGTPLGCPAGATNVVGRATGPGGWAGGLIILSNTSNGVSNVAEMSLRMSDTFLGIAQANATTVTVGRYDLTITCQDRLSTTIFGTFTGSVWFTDPNNYQSTDPNPTPTPTPTTATPTPTTPTATPTPAPTLLAAAALSGTARVGSTLTCIASFSGATSTSYQWLRSGVALAGAVTNKLALTTTHLGKPVACRVVGSNGGGSTATTSAGKTVGFGLFKILGAPTIHGTSRVGRTLKATHGSWSPAGTTYSYRWRRNGRNIKHATHATHKLVSADKGHKITVVVTVRRSGYVTALASSRARRIS